MIAKKDYELIKAIKNHKCCGKSDSSSSDDSSASGEITIDDVVKFIHDNTEDSPFDIPTKYDDIKHISEPLNNGMNLVKGTSEEILNFIQNNTDPSTQYQYSILESTNYAIAVISKNNMV